MKRTESSNEILSALIPNLITEIPKDVLISEILSKLD